MMDKKEMEQERMWTPATEIEALHLIMTTEDKVTHMRRMCSIEATAEYH